MPVSTRKANVDVHPGRVLLDSQQTRRTRKQVEDDDAMARAAAKASKEKATAKYRAVVGRIAQLEDEVALVDKDRQTYANRPDLREESTKSAPEYGSHDPLDSREKDLDSGCDDDSASEKGDPGPDWQSNADAHIELGTAGIGGDNDEGSGPAYDDGECNGDTGDRDLQFSDEDAGVTAVRCYMPTKKKQVSVAL